MDTVETPSPNGIAAAIEQELVSRPALGAGALRRLQRLQARMDGATEVAQAAVNTHQAARDAYQSAFVAACEDSSIDIPPGPHDVDIDWTSGAVRFIPKND
jgi:hypothetical protein